MELKSLFNAWARHSQQAYLDKQWLLSRWEVCEGIEWPKAKIDAMAAHLKESLGLASQDRLLDLGCGGGWILQTLRPHAADAVGVDFSWEMLQNARRFSPQEKLICAEIGRLPFKDASQPCVLCYFVFINFMDDKIVQQALSDIIRILPKGGRALIGQLPDKSASALYDREKAAYLEYCQKTFHAGRNLREVHQMPQKLYDRKGLEIFLKVQPVRFSFRDSFNPFFRPGEPLTISWHFDLFLEK